MKHDGKDRAERDFDDRLGATLERLTPEQLRRVEDFFQEKPSRAPSDVQQVVRRFVPSGGPPERFADLPGGAFFYSGGEVWQKGPGDGPGAARVTNRQPVGTFANFGVFLPHEVVTVACEIT